MSLTAQIMAVLSTVTNPEPESDPRVTDLGYVRAVTIDDNGVTIHLQAPRVLSSQNSAYLSAFEIQSALWAVDGIGAVEVLLDDEPDIDTISADSAFLHKLHRAALERCVSALVRRDSLGRSAIQRLILRDLPDGSDKTRLLRCRYALGLSLCPNSRILVDDDGRPLPTGVLPV